MNDRTRKYQAVAPGDDVARNADRAAAATARLDTIAEQWRDGDPSEQTTAILWVNGAVGGNVETAAVLRTLVAPYGHRSRRRHADQWHLLRAPRSVLAEQWQYGRVSHFGEVGDDQLDLLFELYDPDGANSCLPDLLAVAAA